MAVKFAITVIFDQFSTICIFPYLSRMVFMTRPVKFKYVKNCKKYDGLRLNDKMNLMKNLHFLHHIQNHWSLP
jgi:hypothetical protein